MADGMVLHCGGWEATIDDLEAVETPTSTRSYKAVPYPALVELAHNQIDRAGLSVTREQYALNKEGNQFFALFNLSGPSINDLTVRGIKMQPSLAMRSSHDKSLKVKFLGAFNIFACDNLAMSGYLSNGRAQDSSHKHSPGVYGALPNMLYEQLRQIIQAQAEDAKILEDWSDIDLDPGNNVSIRLPEVYTADGEQIEKPYNITVPGDMAIRFALSQAQARGILGVEQNAQVLKEFISPSFKEFDDPNVFNLYNAYTTRAREWEERHQVEGARRFSNLLMEVFSPN